MNRVEPLNTDEIGALKPSIEYAQQMLGFVPNDLMAMAHMPQLPIALMLMAGCAMGSDLKADIERLAHTVPDRDSGGPGLEPELIFLIAYTTSLSSGCRYCQAHTAKQTSDAGVSAEKINQILTYDESELFTPAERCAIDLAFSAAQTPNAATDDHFAALREHFTERQIIQIVAVISLFGFLNRWNDTLATALEVSPIKFATEKLGESGWEPGKHAS